MLHGDEQRPAVRREGRPAHLRPCRYPVEHSRDRPTVALDVTGPDAVANPELLLCFALVGGNPHAPLEVECNVVRTGEPAGWRKRAAIPGLMTTAYLALKIFEPDFVPVVVPFDKILETVAAGAADAGLIIHEAQLTYNKEGFYRVLDLGKDWKERYGLPLPLGCNVLKRSLAPDVKLECCKMMRESIQYALDHHSEALEYAMQFARDMEPRLAEQFIGMYVNHYTVDAGEVIPKAVKLLYDKGFEVGLLPNQVEVEFARG